MKRHTVISRTDSPDGDCSDTDVFYDDSTDMLKDGSPSQSCHRSDRKRRRGVIEKRRRDRINNSLCELRRLVPAAFEKQDSAKLEKAEILQMTVDHLKTLHAKAALGAGAGYNIDTAALALDCRLVGFRECAAEVARYLVSVEGLDIQDPLRVRLMSHLQCFNAQRESAAKATTNHQGQGQSQTSSWSSHPVSSSHHQYTGQPSSAINSGMMSHHQHQLLGESNSPAAYLDHNNRISHVIDGHGNRLMTSSHGVSGSSGGAPSIQSHQFLSGHQHSSSLLASLPPVHHTSQFLHGPSSGPPSLPMLSPNSLHYGPSTASMLAQGVKPYRPWGAELAY